MASTANITTWTRIRCAVTGHDEQLVDRGAAASLQGRQYAIECRRCGTHITGAR